MNLETAVKNLTAHGFSVRVFRTAQDAANAISQELSGKTVGFGGSVTLEQMQLFETLQKNNTVYWHWKQTPAQALENARRQSLAIANDMVRAYGMLDVKLNKSLIDNIMVLGLRHAVEPLDAGNQPVRWELP